MKIKNRTAKLYQATKEKKKKKIYKITIKKDIVLCIYF